MHSIVYITTSDMKKARKIARFLVEKRLAACVNMFPITSVYRWEGKMCEDTEVALSVKTTTRRVKEVIKEVRRMHSYETPCIISYEISDGDRDYLDWVGAEVAGGRRAGTKKHL